MPSGVSSFLLDCMDLDSEAEDTLPSIEVVRKADTYGMQFWYYRQDVSLLFN